MNFSYDLQNKIVAIETAYIYNQLYKAEFVKSKPITRAEYSHNLRSKCMHIIKSKIKKIADENANIFTNVKFNDNFMIINFNTFDNFLYKGVNIDLVDGFIALVAQNTETNMKKYFNINYSAYGKFLQYRLNLVYPGTSNNLKEELDNFINALMYIPISFNIINDFIQNYANRDHNRVYSLYDLYLYAYRNGGVSSLRADINIEDFKEIVLDEFSTVEQIRASYNLYTTINEYLIANNMAAITEEQNEN